MKKKHEKKRSERTPLRTLPDTFLNRWPAVAMLLRGVMIDLVIESLCRHSVLEALKFVVEAPHMFLYNVLIIATSYSFSLLVTRRTFVDILVTVIWLGLGLADFILLFFRTTPLSFIDLTLIPSVKSIAYHYLSVALVAGVVIGVIGLIALIVIGLLRTGRYERRFGHVACMPAFVLATVLATMLLVRVGLLPRHYDNLISAYRENGFAYCFLRTLVDQGVSEPEDYGEKSIEEILDEIGREGEEKTGIRPNIIFVQLESFFDPAHLIGLELDENPVPVFTRLRESCPSGQLTVPVFGGGTVNTEFEVLTGMSVRDFGAGEYPYHTVLLDRPCESICYNLKEEGYSAHALHNNTATFYNRYKVYANLGFDTFTSVEYMNGVEQNPTGWAKDSVLTGYILTALNSTETPDVVMAVTVQPHGSYPDDVLDDPAIVNSETVPDTVSGNAFAYYVSQLQETDAFVGELVEALSRLDEPTIAVFYGDHLPNFAITDDMLDTGSIFESEYVIWSNFNIDIPDRDLNAWQLSAYVMDIAGFDNGLLTRLHQHFSDSSNYEGALQQLEYDMLYGEQSVYEDGFPYEPTELKMGVRDIGISSVRCGEKLLSVYGTNFTSSSAVCINGTSCYTEFVSPTELLAMGRAREGDLISVQQISEGVAVSETDALIVGSAAMSGSQGPKRASGEDS